MRSLCTFLGMMAIAPAWAGAGEPTGFDRFAFGTTRHTLVGDPLFLARCRPAPALMPQGVGVTGARLTCPAYTLNDLGVMRAALLFSAEDRLVGYVLYVPQGRQAEVRATLETQYGPPTGRLEQGKTLTWMWPSGTEASLTPFCRGTDGCLTVKGKGPEKQ